MKAQVIRDLGADEHRRQRPLLLLRVARTRRRRRRHQRGRPDLARRAHEWIKPRVSRDARQDHRDQTPSLVLGNGVANADEVIVAWDVAKLDRAKSLSFLHRL